MHQNEIQDRETGLSTEVRTEMNLECVRGFAALPNDFYFTARVDIRTDEQGE